MAGMLGAIGDAGPDLAAAFEQNDPLHGRARKQLCRDKDAAGAAADNQEVFQGALRVTDVKDGTGAVPPAGGYWRDRKRSVYASPRIGRGSRPCSP
jgi:hypothetical protein